MITLYLIIKACIDLMLFVPRLIIRLIDYIAFPYAPTRPKNAFSGTGVPFIIGGILGILAFPFMCIKPFNKHGVKW